MEEMKKLRTDVKHGGSVSQTCLNVGFATVVDFLGVTHDGEQREARLNEHSLIPGAFFAQFDVIGDPFCPSKAPIGHKNSVAIICFKVIQEVIIWAIERVPNPGADLAHCVQHPTELHAHAPTSLVFSFLAKLLRAASLPNRRD